MNTFENTCVALSPDKIALTQERMFAKQSSMFFTAYFYS